jgi:hypothetical protein
VTRPCALLELEDRRCVRGEPSAFFVEEELEHLVGAKVRHEHKAVRVVSADGMRIARRRDDLERLADPAVRPDRIHAHLVSAIGRAEEKAAATIKRDVRVTLRERSGADEVERA